MFYIYSKDQSKDLQKGLALGIIIGASVALIASSEKTRTMFRKKSAADIRKERIKELTTGAFGGLEKAQQKAQEVRDKLSEKNK